MAPAERLAERWIGIDIGGSAVKLGAITPQGQGIAERSLPASSSTRVDVLFDALALAVLEVAETDSPGTIGVGVPGLLDRERGAVLESPNLPWMKGVNVRAALAERLHVVPGRVQVENDANVAALGELWLGAARGARNAFVLTLGTGIGGGMVLNGELYVGEGSAGEIGHVTVDPSGRRCGCGARGCLETLASASAAQRRSIELSLPADDPGNLELLAAQARARAGPERSLLQEIGADLGRGLAVAVSLLDVRSFVFAGGFSAALDTLEAGIRRGLAERAYGERLEEVSLSQAALGSRAGWIGAAWLGAH